jgi:hypothetical protein
MTFSYIVPVSYTPRSNYTYINKKVYSFKECSILGLNDKSSLWNANRCPNDGCYCQPYLQGDTILLQYNSKQFGPDVKKIIPELVDDQTDEPISSADFVTYTSGTDANGVTYHNIAIDTTNLSACFYVRLNIFKCTPNAEELTACQIYGGDSELECYKTLCGPSATTYYITEPYCKLQSCKQNSILIEGSYTTYDCEGKYYGEFTGGIANTFKPRLRVPGSIEWYDHTTDETLVNRIRTRARGIDKYRLRTHKIPPFVARQIAMALDSQKILVDDVEYKGGTKMSKDFEEGLSWIISTDLFIECGENNFACK